MLKLNAKIVPKNICICDRIEWGAKVNITEDGRTNQVRWVIVVAVEVLFYLSTCVT